MSAVLPASTPSAPALRHPMWVLAAVCALALMSTAGVAMPYPILAPIFVSGPVDGFTHWLGLPPQLLMGLALAANPLGILLGSLVVGPMSDRYGRRRVLTITLSATLVGTLLTAWGLAERWYPLFLAARFVTGLTEGNVAVARALLADMHPQIDRTRGFAWLNACLYSGWLLGPLIGGLSLPLGEPVPFLLAAAALLPCLVVLAVGVPASAPKPLAGGLLRAMREQQALGLLRQDALLRRLFWLQLCFALGCNSLYEFAPLWLLENLGLDSRGIAFVTAGQCLAMTLASVLASRLAAQGGGGGARPLRRAGAMAMLAACGLTALALLPGYPGMAVIMLLGVPLALYNALMPAWVSERFAAHGQGRVMGLLSTIFCIANVAVALGGGLLALLDVRWIMALGGLMALGAASLLLRLARLQAGEAGQA